MTPNTLDRSAASVFLKLPGFVKNFRNRAARSIPALSRFVDQTSTEAQSCWIAIGSGGQPPFPTLRLSRLNDLPGNLKASQPEDSILEAFNRSKDRSSQRVSRLGRAVYPR
jgi:hypothetical protein